MTVATPAYDDLATLQQRLYRLQHLGSIAGWDQASNMPKRVVRDMNGEVVGLEPMGMN